MMYYWLLLCTVMMGLLHLPCPCHAQLQVEAVFHQLGVSGSIMFSQSSPHSTFITVTLTGLDNFETSPSFPWHVHEYPFPLDSRLNPCKGANTGGHYDPLGASNVPDYETSCASNPTLCELGDLSGRLGALPSSGQAQHEDSVGLLYGVYSIIGRSIVVHRSNGSRLVCANIGYPSSQGQDGELLYVPFRSLFSGNIYFRQHISTGSSRSVASVHTDLASSDSTMSDSSGHNWHVHEVPLEGAEPSCGDAGPHYNPRNEDVMSPSYAMFCSPSNQNSCEIGDLSNKGSPFDVEMGMVRQFYTDTDLPLLEEASEEGFSIAGRSVVIHAADRGAPRIDCANILPYVPLRAEAVFLADEGSEITGRVTFLQTSPFDLTTIEVQLEGLGGDAGGYHVHVTPMGPPERGFPERCSGTYAGVTGTPWVWSMMMGIPL